MSAPLPPAILLMGPTASGKTASALALARSLPIEIISVDSALVFRDMDIGTAKPSPEEQASCPHHLIDVISPEDAYSAARFRDDALRLMGEITGRGNIPVLAGGTMLYFKALREGLSELPQADAALRTRIDTRARAEGWPALHAELARLDPEAAAGLNPNDAQRIQRAIEIVSLSGRPLSENYAQREMAPPPYRFIGIALDASDRAVLHARIAQRFNAMLADGFVDEVRQLRERYTLDLSMPSMRCVGYRQAWGYIDGEVDEAGFRAMGIAATRQLAKRQITWQRKFLSAWQDVCLLDCLDPDLPAHVSETVCNRLGNATPGA